MWNLRGRDELKARHLPFEFGQWVRIYSPTFENKERIETDERKAARLIVFLGGFEEETRLAVVDLGERGDRRLDISNKIDKQGNEVAALCQNSRFVAGRKNG